VLLRGIGSDAALEARAQQLRAAVALHAVEAAGVSVRLTISVGAARSGSELGTLDALVEAADGCLYEGKQRGRNTVVCQSNKPARTDKPLLRAVC